MDDQHGRLSEKEALSLRLLPLELGRPGLVTRRKRDRIRGKLRPRHIRDRFGRKPPPPAKQGARDVATHLAAASLKTERMAERANGADTKSHRAPVFRRRCGALASAIAHLRLGVLVALAGRESAPFTAMCLTARASAHRRAPVIGTSLIAAKDSFQVVPIGVEHESA